jgi:hypothetical protein
VKTSPVLTCGFTAPDHFGTIHQGRDPRVVTVSSGEHKGGSIYFDDLTGERSYSPRAFYQQSKFATA